MKSNLKSALLIAMLGGTPALHGALLINTLGTHSYSQDFDGLDVSADVADAGTGAPLLWDGVNSATTWQNSTTYVGWTRQVTIGDNANRQDKDYIGEFTSGTIRFGNMGSSATNSTDRALGVLMQGIVGDGNSASFGVVFEVGNGLNVSSATVSYTGEQWFRAPTAATLNFQYKILSSYNPSTFLINSETGWTDFDSLDFTASVTGNNSKINGNNNQTALSDTINLSATEGEFIAFRWSAVSTTTGAQSGLGVDDVSINFTTIPEPSSAMLVLLAAGAMFRRTRR